MNIITRSSRREFIKKGGVLVAAASAFGVTSGLLGAENKEAGKEEEDVSPAEDLMREHGVLKRVLLVYGEYIRRIDAKDDLPPEPLADAARIISTFIEDYHEKLEEDYLFPRFRKANKHVALVDELQKQHEAGRRVTGRVIRLATTGFKDAG